MLKFFEKKAKKNDYYEQKLQSFKYPKKKNQMKELETFQMFTLHDLIGLANSEKILKIPDSINDLRNTIMHAKNVVKHRDYEVANLIYDFTSFQNFFNSVKEIKRKIDEVTNKTRVVKDADDVMRLKKAGLLIKVKD